QNIFHFTRSANGAGRVSGQETASIGGNRSPCHAADPPAAGSRAASRRGQKQQGSGGCAGSERQNSGNASREHHEETGLPFGKRAGALRNPQQHHRSIIVLNINDRRLVVRFSIDRNYSKLPIVGS